LYKISEELQFIGKQVIFLPKCRSTNDTAAELWKQGILSNGSIVITDNQYAGRGQRGNIWKSDANMNLTFSIVIQPSFLLPVNSYYLNIIASLSIINALNQKGFQKFKIKWPNDILFDNQKLAGILIENSIQSGRIINSIIGIGINVNQKDFDENFSAASLRTIFGASQNLNDLLNRILFQLEQMYEKLKNEGIIDLKKRYTRNLYWINEEHTFKTSVKFRGVITGINDFGQLEVDVRGNKQKFNFKDISYIK
jgi:BirA family biotin operon repressor/biotin-[acetyl-CoA-carboxylase] ligase